MMNSSNVCRTEGRLFFDENVKNPSKLCRIAGRLLSMKNVSKNKPNMWSSDNGLMFPRYYTLLLNYYYLHKWNKFGKYIMEDDGPPSCVDGYRLHVA